MAMLRPAMATLVPEPMLERPARFNKLVEEFSTAALAEFDAETRFLARAARGNAKRGLALLRKIDRGGRRR